VVKIQINYLDSFIVGWADCPVCGEKQVLVCSNVSGEFAFGSHCKETEETRKLRKEGLAPSPCRASFVSFKDLKV